MLDHISLSRGNMDVTEPNGGIMWWERIKDCLIVLFMIAVLFALFWLGNAFPGDYR
jgi:hypothetical protein